MMNDELNDEWWIDWSWKLEVRSWNLASLRSWRFNQINLFNRINPLQTVNCRL